MATSHFFDDQARDHVQRVTAAVEADSAVEIVVAMRARSWRYRHAHFMFGFIVALTLLCALLFLPQPFDILYWPLELTAAFVLGAALCMNLAPLERLLATKRIMADQVERAAKAAFFDLGVSYTTGRTGLLIYVSMAERQIALVADAGLEEAQRSTGYQKAQDAMEDAVRRADFDAFIAGMKQLAEPLATALPRQADDVNELADEVA